MDDNKKETIVSLSVSIDFGEGEQDICFVNSVVSARFLASSSEARRMIHEGLLRELHQVLCDKLKIADPAKAAREKAVAVAKALGTYYENPDDSDDPGFPDAVSHLDYPDYIDN